MKTVLLMTFGPNTGISKNIDGKKIDELLLMINIWNQKNDHFGRI